MRNLRWNGDNMDIFEKHFEMLKNNEEIFRKYSIKDDKGLILSDEKKKDFYIKGRDLLSDEIAKYFLEIRSIYYHNVINNNLQQYSFYEWIVCLEENILLEYAIPIFSRVLQEYPMLCGMNYEWQVMYEIAKIKEDFWLAHIDWKIFFVDILKRFSSEYEDAELIEIFSKKYFYQFKKFVEMK